MNPPKETDMATTVRTSAPKPSATRVPMTSARKTALVAGVFYLITFISIPTLALYGPVKNHRDWILSSGSHTGVVVGAFLEVVVALAGIGTAVTLYPVVKRQNEAERNAFVFARLLEAAMIFTGVLSLLSLVTLRHDLGGAAGANAAALVTTGASHVAVYNGTMLLGQTLMPCINALLLGSLMYRSRLVPRIIPIVGLIGAPLLLAAVIATLFSGDIGHVSAFRAIATFPVAAWEFSLGVWLVVKGFRPSPITADMTAADTGRVLRDVLRLPPVAKRTEPGAARRCGCCRPGAGTRSRAREPLPLSPPVSWERAHQGAQGTERAGRAVAGPGREL